MLRFARNVTFVIIAIGAVVPANSALFDLDTDIPAGPPSDWARGLPVLTPIFPPVRTAPREQPKEPGPAVDTMVEPRRQTKATDARQLRSTSLADIVTVDVVSHIPWTDPGAYGYGKNPGGDARANRTVGEWERSYWMGLVALLRVLLHPEQVSRAETTAFLIELGEAALPAVRAAQPEGVLSEICSEVRSSVGVEYNGNIKYLEGSSPVEKMYFRFVADELMRASPYDPKGFFARRIEMFGEEMYPYVSAYTQHEIPRLRRNAVSALGLFRTRSVAEKLVYLALTSKDAVIRIRSLAMLSQMPLDSNQILQLSDAIAKAPSKAEAVRIVHTVGAQRNSAALPGILKFAKKYEADGDVLPAGLSALARLATSGPKGEASEFIRNIYNKAKVKSGAWKAAQDVKAHLPDIPDPEDGRRIIIEQLAAIGIIQTCPPDTDFEKMIQKWAAVGGPQGNLPVEFNGTTAWGRLASRLGSVAPVAQYDYLDALAKIGGAANGVLREIVISNRYNISVRGYAMRLLPESDQFELSRAWLSGRAEIDEGLDAVGLEILDLYNDPNIHQLASDFLYRYGMNLPLSNWPARRIMASIAIRILASRNAGADALIEFVKKLGPAGISTENRAEELKTAVERIVNLQASGAPQTTVRDAAVELVNDLYNKYKLRADSLGPEWRKEKLQYILELLKPLAKKQKNDAERLGIIDSIFASLRPVLEIEQLMEDRSHQSNDVPLEDVAILALGRSRDGRCHAALRALLATNGYKHIGATCYALGVARDRLAAKTIYEHLLDSDPFVRLCAYRALKLITGRDFFCDWIGGSSMDWAEAARKYKEIID
ncbi:MAG: HEAT repeat domain-containing protein [Planctomycetota bacterium]